MSVTHLLDGVSWASHSLSSCVMCLDVSWWCSDSHECWCSCVGTDNPFSAASRHTTHVTMHRVLTLIMTCRHNDVTMHRVLTHSQSAHSLTECSLAHRVLSRSQSALSLTCTECSHYVEWALAHSHDVDRCTECSLSLCRHFILHRIMRVSTHSLHHTTCAYEHRQDTWRCRGCSLSSWRHVIFHSWHTYKRHEHPLSRVSLMRRAPYHTASYVCHESWHVVMKRVTTECAHEYHWWDVVIRVPHMCVMKKVSTLGADECHRRPILRIASYQSASWRVWSSEHQSLSHCLICVSWYVCHECGWAPTLTNSKWRGSLIKASVRHQCAYRYSARLHIDTVLGISAHIQRLLANRCLLAYRWWSAAWNNGVMHALIIYDACHDTWHDASHETWNDGVMKSSSSVMHVMTHHMMQSCKSRHMTWWSDATSSHMISWSNARDDALKQVSSEASEHSTLLPLLTCC